MTVPMYVFMSLDSFSGSASREGVGYIHPISLHPGMAYPALCANSLFAPVKQFPANQIPSQFHWPPALCET